MRRIHFNSNENIWETLNNYSLKFNPNVKYPKFGYVYFLYKYGIDGYPVDSLQYVGQTHHLNKRINQHLRKKDFDSARFIPISQQYCGIDVVGVEKYFIDTFTPPLNHPSTIGPPRISLFRYMTIVVDYEGLIERMGTQ